MAARHGTRQASRAEIFNYASIPLIFIGGAAGYALRQAAMLAFLKTRFASPEVHYRTVIRQFELSINNSEQYEKAFQRLKKQSENGGK